MGAARYVGRIGGLAVALGIGTALLTGYGVASADDTSTSTATNAESPAGPSKPEHLGIRPLLSELSAAMRDASICGLGQAAPNPLLSVIKYFPEEFLP